MNESAFAVGDRFGEEDRLKLKCDGVQNPRAVHRIELIEDNQMFGGRPGLTGETAFLHDGVRERGCTDHQH